MKVIAVNGQEYKLEYSFEAAEYRDVVQKMFNVLSGAYLIKHSGVSINMGDIETGNTEEDTKRKDASYLVDGASGMVAEIPHICITAFYAGLLENNPMSEKEAKDLMKSYMKENKVSYAKLYDEIRECMVDDGFFDLSGLSEMLQNQSEIAQEIMKEKKQPKQPQDHKKKSTSTK